MNRLKYIQKRFSAMPVFCPAIGPSIIKWILDYIPPTFNKIINPYGNNPPLMKWNSYLLSAGVINISKNSRFSDIDKLIIGNDRQDILKVGDSGGFQMISFEGPLEKFKPSPEDLLVWYENNVDIGVILDFPPYIKQSYTQIVSNNKLKKCVDITVNNIKRMISKRSNSNLILNNVLHGDTFEQIEFWYDKVSKFSLEGWSIAVKPATNPIMCTLLCIYLHSKKEFDKENFKGFHFLGATSSIMSVVYNILFLEFFKNKGVIVTCDSSTYTAGSRWTDYFLTNGIGRISTGTDSLAKNNIKTINLLPCSCPICEMLNNYFIENESFFFTKGEYGNVIEVIGKSNLYELFNLHNYFVLNSVHLTNLSLMTIFGIDYVINKNINYYKDIVYCLEIIKKYKGGISIKDLFALYQDVYGKKKTNKIMTYSPLEGNIFNE